MRHFVDCFSVALVLLAIGGIVGCERATSKKPVAQTDSKLTDSPNDDELRTQLDEVLTYTVEKRRLDTSVNAAWQVMHGVLAFGRDFQVMHNGQLVPAAEWLLDGGTLNGWTVRKGDQGIKVVLETGTKTGQGHEDQWLSKLTWCELPSDRSVTVAGEKYTIGDMIKQAMWDLYEGKECSWTLIVLAKYVPLDAEWEAKDGQKWTQERVIAMEAAQDINASPCGGSHRLAGMTISLDRYRKEHPGEALTGGWLAADQKIQDAIQKAKEFQQPSGTFSVHYFQRASDSPDLTAHIGSTGHTLEFLTLALSDEQLREPWMRRAVARLCKLFDQTKEVDLECGALYHAAHGLLLYRERCFGKRKYGNDTNVAAADPARQDGTATSADKGATPAETPPVETSDAEAPATETPAENTSSS